MSVVVVDLLVIVIVVGWMGGGVIGGGRRAIVQGRGVVLAWQWCESCYSSFCCCSICDGCCGLVVVVVVVVLLLEMTVVGVFSFCLLWRRNCLLSSCVAVGVGVVDTFLMMVIIVVVPWATLKLVIFVVEYFVLSSFSHARLVWPVCPPRWSMWDLCYCLFVCCFLLSSVKLPAQHRTGAHHHRKHRVEDGNRPVDDTTFLPRWMGAVVPIVPPTPIRWNFSCVDGQKNILQNQKSKNNKQTNQTPNQKAREPPPDDQQRELQAQAPNNNNNNSSIKKSPQQQQKITTTKWKQWTKQWSTVIIIIDNINTKIITIVTQSWEDHDGWTIPPGGVHLHVLQATYGIDARSCHMHRDILCRAENDVLDGTEH